VKHPIPANSSKLGQVSSSQNAAELSRRCFLLSTQGPLRIRSLNSPKDASGRTQLFGEIQTPTIQIFSRPIFSTFFFACAARPPGSFPLKIPTPSDVVKTGAVSPRGSETQHSRNKLACYPFSSRSKSPNSSSVTSDCWAAKRYAVVVRPSGSQQSY
jgi:hypothetical protein